MYFSFKSPEKVGEAFRIALNGTPLYNDNCSISPGGLRIAITKILHVKCGYSREDRCNSCGGEDARKPSKMAWSCEMQTYISNGSSSITCRSGASQKDEGATEKNVDESGTKRYGGQRSR